MSTPSRVRAPSTLARDLWRATSVAAALLSPAHSAALCPLPPQRAARIEAPRLALHFGAPKDVPSHIVTTALADEQAADLCVPIWAYGLGAGADVFEFAVLVPRPPRAFEPGPLIADFDARFSVHTESAVCNLRLTARTPLCGPALLGCLRLAAEDVPERFGLLVLPHEGSGHRGMRLADRSWHEAAVDDGGAWIGMTPPCEDRPALNRAVSGLRVAPGALPASLEITWEPGSGTETLLRYRIGGPHPATTSAGEFMAILPAGIDRHLQVFDTFGDVHVTAWSITRGPSGRIDVPSGIECGSLATGSVHLPVDSQSRSWGQLKVLYR